MTRRNVLVGSCLAVVIGVTGCQDAATAPAPLVAGSARSSESTLPESVPLARGAFALPSSVLVTHLNAAGVASRAIDPADYVCSSSSRLGDWLNAEIVKTLTAERANFFALYNRSADLIPVYEAVFFQTSATPQTFGYAGEFTKTMVKTERDVKGFWDIPSDDIQVLAMHGSVLLDTARTAQTYRFLGVKPATATAWAATIRAALLKSPTMPNGNHPFWTFNAVAFSTTDGSIPDKIVMGDGILAGYQAVGLGDVAPQAIFAHEFAHQIQFENGYFEDAIATAGTPPEQTRYTELMADAMSAYYLTHSRGATMNRKRVEQFLDVFFQIGDCAFKSDGHHGTPNQRLAAARFGFDLADQAQKQGHILTSKQFYDLFVAEYPALIAPDAR